MQEKLTLPDAANSQLRTEDMRLVTGAGRYLDNVAPKDAGCVMFVRSPVAHAHITNIDIAAAAGLAGVRAVLTGADVAAHGIPDLAAGIVIDGQRDALRPVIARDRVRHVGEIVAMVVADTVAIARDAVDLVLVDYDDLPVIVDPAKSLGGEPKLHDSAPGNIAYDWQGGDADATDTAFASADRIVSVTLDNNRLIINPMEPRGALGAYDAQSGTYTLHAPSQGAHLIRDILAEKIFGVGRDKVRVVTGDVGGAFGIRLQIYPEIVLVLLAARITGRPAKWTAERAETFVADAHGRAQINTGHLALDNAGRILGFRVESIADLGAYFSTFTTIVASSSGTRILGHTYRIPAMHAHVRAVFTNTVPVDSFRGAGKPELVYLLERLIDMAARDMGFDPIGLRRRNLLRPEELPLDRPFGPNIDCGDFANLLDIALEHSDWVGFGARRDAAVVAGKCAGIGLGFYVHAAGAFPVELSTIVVDPAGTVVVTTGAQASGQGHETVFAQVAASKLGIAVERIIVRQGDTDDLARGSATGGSNSITVNAVNIARASGLLIEHGKVLAATALEAAPGDIEFADGAFSIVGTDVSVDLFELAARAPQLAHLLDGVEPNMSVGCDFEGDANTFPNGCYICEVEVDPQTGVVEVTGFTAIDDVGIVLNEAITRGQIVGGITQSLGQAMMEHTVFDGDSGQLLSGSLMDYCLPRADDLPAFEQVFVPVPTLVNPLGAKGAGEVGCVGALAPVVLATLDALRPLGVEHLDMPLTPERVWRAIHGK